MKKPRKMSERILPLPSLSLLNARLWRLASKAALASSFALSLIGCRQAELSEETPIAFLAQTDGVWQVWRLDTQAAEPRRISKLNQDVVRLSWFPNGRELLLNLQNGKLIKLDTVSGGTSQVDFPDRDVQDAVIGPDGRSIAYSISIADSNDRNDIWLFDMASAKRRKLTVMPGLQHEPAWSPDGRWIYFLSAAGPQSHNIWRVEVETGNKEQLTVNALYHFDPAVRADGAIAYSSNRGGDYDLWLSASAKDDPQRLTDDPALDARPTWSPDGRALLFESTREGGVSQLWRYDVDTKNLRRVTQVAGGARMPVWAPLGARR